MKVKITKDRLQQIILEEILREEPEAPAQDAKGGIPTASAGDVKNKLLDLAKNVADIPSSQLGALLVVMDEVLQLAKQEQLKAKASTIVKGLDRFDK